MTGPRYYRPPPLRRVTTSHTEAERAADRLEDLLPHLGELITEVRLRRVDAYASLYDLRRRVTWVLRDLGSGEPARTLRRHDWRDELS